MPLRDQYVHDLSEVFRTFPLFPLFLILPFGVAVMFYAISTESLYQYAIVGTCITTAIGHKTPNQWQSSFQMIKRSRYNPTHSRGGVSYNLNAEIHKGNILRQHSNTICTKMTTKRETIITLYPNNYRHEIRLVSHRLQHVSMVSLSSIAHCLVSKRFRFSKERNNMFTFCRIRNGPVFISRLFWAVALDSSDND